MPEDHETITVSFPKALIKRIDRLVENERPRVSRSALITMWAEDGAAAREAAKTPKART
jgi:metal-responsive CopG/Arc/MetJ family transcriptional regulator